MSETWRICHACGREVEMVPGQALGDALSGWVIVSRLKDKDSFDRFSFCSLSCLKRWVENQIPAIPDVFLRSLDDNSCNP